MVLLVKGRSMATEQDQQVRDEKPAGDAAADKAAAGDGQESTPRVPLPATFRLPKLSYFTVGFTLFAAWIVAGAAVEYLWWLFALPILQLVWMVRIKTVITDSGLVSVTALRRREIPWAELEGLQFRRWGSVQAVLIDSTSVKLPAITFRDMPLLSSASRGRIPDPYASARAALAERDEVDTNLDDPGKDN